MNVDPSMLGRYAGVTTEISEDQKKDSQVRKHLVECGGSKNDIESKILTVAHETWRNSKLRTSN